MAEVLCVRCRCRTATGSLFAYCDTCWGVAQVEILTNNYRSDEVNEAVRVANRGRETDRTFAGKGKR